MVGRMYYRIRDEQGEIVRDLMVDLDLFEPMNVGDVVTSDDGKRLKITDFRRVDAETRDVLTKPAPPE